MNKTEEIEKLFAKDKEYKIPAEPKAGDKQATVVVKQIEIDQIGIFEQKDNPTPEENLKQIYKMFELSLGLKEEQSKKISVAYMQELVEAIMDANNVSAEEQKSSNINKFLAKKREQISKETEKDGITD